MDPPKFEVNLREFIANARRSNPNLAAAFGTDMETTRTVQEAEFALKVAGANEPAAHCGEGALHRAVPAVRRGDGR
ncbi:hypothetical protein ACE1OC_00085 [Streptomyces sp. DSM 116496]|uniref:hypothetical protein n=1 Tax=Streptomyces stoeckheimensis TaxID=3344656 RepID=UPI0038B377D1